MSLRSPLERLRHLDRSSSTFHDQINNILCGEEYQQWVSTVRDDGLVALVDCLDKAFDNLDSASPAFLRCLHELRRVCSTRTIFPPSHTLSPQVLAVDAHSIASGGSGDAYEGLLDGSRVYVKRVRVYSKDGPERATKTLYRDAIVWKHLEHRNIVPFLGITPNPLQLISEWMPGGHLTECIKEHPGAYRFDLLSDVAEGLHFLHSCNVVHGDLNGPNIIVGYDGLHAWIIDFGLAAITRNLDPIRSLKGDQGHTLRWTDRDLSGNKNRSWVEPQRNEEISRIYSVGESGSSSNPLGASRRDSSGMNGYATGNPSSVKLSIGTKSRPQPRLNLNATPGQNQSFPPLRTQDDRESPGQGDSPGRTNQQINGGGGGEQEWESQDVSENISDHPPERRHGVWCRLKKYCSGRSRDLLMHLPKVHLPNGRDQTNGSLPVGHRDRPGSDTKSAGTHLHDERKDGSRIGLSLLNRTSAGDASGVTNGNSIANTSHHDSLTGTGYSHQSQTNPGTALPEDKRYPLQGPKDRQQFPPNLENHVDSLASRIDDVHRNDREIGGQNISGNCSNPLAWKWLIDPTFPVDKRVDLVTSIFSDRSEIKRVTNISGDDAQAFINAIDEVLAGDKLPPHIRRRCLRSLHKICGRQTILPSSLEIPLCYNPHENPLCYGGFADVWKGTYEGLEVAAKVLRVYQTSNRNRIRKRFCREAVAWKALRHPNVLPLLGATVADNRFVMVSEWMTKGTIKEFTKADTSADRLGLLVEVTKGLIYLHEQGVIHGDLKGANILINRNGRACLADFSLLTVVAEYSTVISSCPEGGTIQWMSPELIHPEIFGLTKSLPTKESDCYALGMVVYEILSGRTPFSPWKAPAVMRKVLDGERPGRPQGDEGSLFTDVIWGVLELCWKAKPRERISAQAVLLGLEGNPSPLVTSPNEDGCAGTDTDDWWGTSSNDSSEDELPIT